MTSLQPLTRNLTSPLHHKVGGGWKKEESARRSTAGERFCTIFRLFYNIWSALIQRACKGKGQNSRSGWDVMRSLLSHSITHIIHMQSYGLHRKIQLQKNCRGHKEMVPFTDTEYTSTGKYIRSNFVLHRLYCQTICVISSIKLEFS